MTQSNIFNPSNAEAIPLSKEHGCKDFFKASKPCHVGIRRIALAEYSQMSTHVPLGFNCFSIFFASFSICLMGHQKLQGKRYNLFSFNVGIRK